MTNYVHGFDSEEQLRLTEQAAILAPMVYKEVDFSDCNELLEVGSGVGAQTRILLEKFPKLKITCVDSSAVQLAKARINLAGFENRVRFVEQDGCALHLEERFDAAFVCWTLEHVSSPLQLLIRLKEHLQPGARVYATEVFNSSLYTTPGYAHLQEYVEVMSAFQRKIGGNPDVGIELGNLFSMAGFPSCTTRFDGFYLDARSGEQRKIVAAYWKGLLKSAAPALVAAEACTPFAVEKMIVDLEKLGNDENAIFFYQFVQAIVTL
ncbi:MAG: class I SAM-dependent methyltransferase [Algoriphagus sp.]|jgi:predicted O-methyltransferase YrrM|uniref:class I SAM-dependent methyltransferase n=1 Tax=Algoriphagus sp. TaxID=1872435 RepID=UPI002760F923|nr:class I SAM-dependent methyltransferase [Algoriphagus sp.]MDP4747093.1 class I SAM-dependent methyltransferase [Algoriphagus sp.]MDP4839039.1 class I SAM-dependent methyltransferase [Algoriphagus sp.]MDP4904085.1 class I SAM-dependent methyltransferase [Algoriphagus sp.]MDP4958013.1 class I SAM-dependent methyltransferase [Algoriphagus sp.]